MPAPMLTRSPGHMRDFIRACKGGDPACSNFDVAAPFVEWMLLGVIALRHEGKLEYDPDKNEDQQQFGRQQTAEAHVPQGLGVPRSEGLIPELWTALTTGWACSYGSPNK